MCGDRASFCQLRRAKVRGSALGTSRRQQSSSGYARHLKDLVGKILKRAAVTINSNREDRFGLFNPGLLFWSVLTLRTIFRGCNELIIKVFGSCVIGREKKSLSVFYYPGELDEDCQGEKAPRHERSGKMHDENLIRAHWNLRIIFLDKCVHHRLNRGKASPPVSTPSIRLQAKPPTSQATSRPRSGLVANSFLEHKRYDTTRFFKSRVFISKHGLICQKTLYLLMTQWA